ncbi:hypothetical protein Glove_310g51 [Diversispora epigaea]|uniref:Uncharacterized protein n=1 Tax=Diversispora epigaea TaxID=1348612 RepID=A0A397HSW5_9GLOM|nr:hypothetical protein Glove_310g51 [Diversispora epigaea]
MENFDTLLTNINRNNIHPEIEEILNFFNSKKPMNDRRATNHLWKIPQHKKSQNTLI